MRLVSFGLLVIALASMACSGTDGAGVPGGTPEPTDPAQPAQPALPAPLPNDGNGGGGAGSSGSDAPAPTAKPITATLTTSTASISQATNVTLGVTIADPDNVGIKQVIFRKKGVLFATASAPPWATTTKVVNVDNGNVEYDAHVIDNLGRAIDSNKVAVSVAIPTPNLTFSANPSTVILPGPVNAVATSSLAVGEIASLEIRSGANVLCTTTMTACSAFPSITRKDNGNDVLEAKLVDKDGNVAIAKALKVDIQPTAYRDQLGGADADGATAVAVDPSGNVFVVGYALAALPNATGAGKVFVRKLDASGTVLWTKRYCTDCQFLPSAAIGANGGLVIASLTGSLENMFASVLRISADGTLLFRSDVAAPTTGFGQVQGVVEGDGGIYLLADTNAGTIAQSTGLGRCVISRFDATNGLRTFARRFWCTMGWNNVFGPVWVGDGVVVAYNDSPNANVWGQPSLHKIDFDGKDPGATKMSVPNAAVKSIARSGSEIFVAYDEYDYSWEKFIPKSRKIARYATSNLTLAGAFTTDATISAMAPDGQGGVFGIMSYSGGLARYNASGTKLFTFANTVDQWFAVAGGPGDVSWLVGRAAGDWVRASAGGVDAVYIGLSASGTPR